MKPYLDLLREVLETGDERMDRTGVGTRSLFGRQVRYDLGDGFPLVTTKKVHLKSIIYELLWFLRGETNARWLQERKVRIWNEWADDDGELGPVYGKQWRRWQSDDGAVIDQVAQAVELICNNPTSRRILVNAWNVGDVPKMALPPCHLLFQFYVGSPRGGSERRTLSCQLYQRSADIFLGVPFNIASYALLTMMVAQVCELDPGDFVHTFGDVHLYSNHIEQAKLQLSREPRPLPTMRINPDVRSIDDFVFEDFKLEGYQPHRRIKAAVAV